MMQGTQVRGTSIHGINSKLIQPRLSFTQKYRMLTRDSLTNT